MRRIVPALTLLLLALAGPALARVQGPAATGPAGLCEAATARAAYESGVPADVLAAVALTETGRRMGGVVRPWAWSVNSEGRGTWFDTPAEALAHARARLAEGRTNLDIGCFQINYRWHGEAFASVAEMFDPLSNARYAADFLRRLHAETGDWRAAAGAFHSRSPKEAAAYLSRFDELHRIARAQGGPAAGSETYNRFSPRVAAAGVAEDPADVILIGETPVPDHVPRGPIDIALATGQVGGDIGAMARPFGGDDSFAALIGMADARHQRGERRRAHQQGRNFLGLMGGEERAPPPGSLALVGDTGSGPLLAGAAPILAPASDQRRALLVAAGDGRPLIDFGAARGGLW